MKTLSYYQLDAFTDGPFTGNPAAVCPLKSWLPDSVMQQIAMENNLSETAFIVPNGDDFDLRWFTPAVEVKLCGHATLATGALLFRLFPDREEVRFHSKSGMLKVTRDKEWYWLDFPRVDSLPVSVTESLQEAFPLTILDCWQEKDTVLLVENADIVRNFEPNFELLKKVRNARGLSITAVGDDCDFVSRFFAPNAGINEDPVTGSLHCQLTPIWADKLGKFTFKARQLSKRGGLLYCELADDRVKVGGRAHLFADGKIYL